MFRSRIEIYWNTAETAPDRVIAQVRVTDNGGSDYLLPYPCELTKEGWVNAASGKPLAVRVEAENPASEDRHRARLAVMFGLKALYSGSPELRSGRPTSSPVEPHSIELTADGHPIR